MNCTPDRIQPRIIALRRSNQTWERIAEILGISMEEVKVNAALIQTRLGISELNKDTLTTLARKLQAAHKDEPVGPRVSKRQMECLRLYARGLTYKEITLALHLSNEQTVQNHVSVACKVIGIQHAGRHRLQRIQEYFNTQQAPATPPPAPTMDDPAFN